METEELSFILEQSINQIAKRNFNVSNPTERVVDGLTEPTNYSRCVTNPEINFVSSVKSKVEQNVIEQGFTEDEDPELFPQSDFGKRVFNLEKHRKLKVDFEINEITKPDLFFHRSQEDTNPENQKIVLECKIETNLSEKKLQKDLAKLIIFIDQLNFQKGILLICNNESEIINNYVDNFVAKYQTFQQSLTKIEIWVKNFDKEIIKRNFR